MPKLQICVADDHPITLEGLSLIICAQPDLELVGKATNGEEAMIQIEGCRPHIAVLDLSFKDMNGIVLGRHLASTCKETRLLALTQSEDRSTLNEALSAGFSGYVIKRSAPRHLIDAIHGVAVGGLYIDPTMASKMFNARQHQASPLTSGDLTEREVEVVKGIALGLTGKDIAERCGISNSSVETYKARACRKLGLTSRTEIVRFAANKGWLASV